MSIAPWHWNPQSVPTAVPTHAVRVPCGAPASTGEQTPTLPGTSHAAQRSPHAVLQHTPSTQELLVHSLPSTHAAPFAFFGLHVPSQ